MTIWISGNDADGREVYLNMENANVVAKLPSNKTAVYFSDGHEIVVSETAEELLGKFAIAVRKRKEEAREARKARNQKRD